jgi:hypothetical protein
MSEPNPRPQPWRWGALTQDTPPITAIGRRIRPADGVHEVIKGPSIKGTIKKP